MKGIRFFLLGKKWQNTDTWRKNRLIIVSVMKSGQKWGKFGNFHKYATRYERIFVTVNNYNNLRTTMRSKRRTMVERSVWNSLQLIK